MNLAKLHSLFFPNPSGNSKFQFLPVTAGEEESHVPLDDEAVKTVANLAVTISNCSRHPLPCHLPSVPAYLETVGIVLCIIIVAHKPQKCYVDWSHSQLKSFEM